MKYIITIPTPCHEDWDRMTPTEQGRYCAVCKKEIYDFTNYSNFHLIKRLDNGQHICGRFNKMQLDKELDSLKEINYARRIALLFGLTSLVASVQPVKAQDTKLATKQTQSDTTQQKNTTPEHHNKVLEDSITIKGRILSFNDSLGLPGVNISGVGQNPEYSTTSDINGNFKITIPKRHFTPKVELRFSYIGFESINYYVNQSDSYLEVQMKEETNELLGGVVVIKKTLWSRIKSLFRKE